MLAGTSWLAGQLKDHASVAVSYRRPSTGESVAVSATPARTVLEEGNTEGIVFTKTEIRDWLIDVADLVLGGEAATPANGDVVDETSGSTTYSYEVLPLGAEPCYSFADAYRVKYRVHSKQVEVRT